MDKVNSIPLPAFMEPYYAKGILDTSFGVNGITRVIIDNDKSFYSLGSTIATDALGRIYVTGNMVSESISEMALWRFNPDGSPDLGFGTNGYITASSAYMDGDLYDDSCVSGMTINSNGIVYVVGGVYNSDRNNMVIWKYDDRAKINKLTIFAIFDAHEYNPAFVYQLGWGIKIDNRGRIVACGVMATYLKMYMAIWRYNINGMLDESFNSTGVVVSDGSEGARIPATTALSNDLAFDDEKKIVACGYLGYTVDSSINDSGIVWCMPVWRFNENGSPDLDFGLGGLVISDASIIGNESFDDTYGNSLVIDSKKRILVAGESQNESTSKMTIWCYNKNGELDLSFGVNGIVVSNNIYDEPYGSQIASTIALDSKGQSLVAGYYSQGIVVWRYNNDGTPDYSFGSDGYLAYEIPLNASNGASMVIDGSGRILLTDEYRFEGHSEMTLWRFK